MPKFKGFEGEEFQLDAPNKFINLISDTNTQLNVYINCYDKIDVIGIKLKNHHIKWNATDDMATLNNNKLNSKTYCTAISTEMKFTFEPELKCLKYNDFVSHLTINTINYQFNITKYHNRKLLIPYFLDINIIINNINLRPHGIIGQTADFNNCPRIVAGTKGEGVIEGNLIDYEVKSIWESNFKYNKFKEV
jgi:hypothetical protein